MELVDFMLDEQEKKVRLVALKIFSKLCAEWSLLPEQSFGLLGFADAEDCYAWQNGNLDNFGNDRVLVIVSHLIAINKLLHQIFRERSQANAWLLKANSAFNGASAASVIGEMGLTGAAIVREYLERQLV